MSSARATMRRTAPFWTGTALLLVAAGCDSREPLAPHTAASGGALSAQDLATDVVRYELTLEVFPESESIVGEGVAVIRALEPIDTVELRLDTRFAVGPVRVDGQETTFEHEKGVLTVALPKALARGEQVSVAIPYEGKPHVAERAPWDGGFVWGRTEQGDLPWIATAVQGTGCDLWWPCKDHFADKPESMDLRVTVPEGLSVALNGVLQSIEPLPDGRRVFHWHVGVPISDYNVSLSIGPFERIETSYEAVNGAQVAIEFWALEEHAEDARALIEEDLREQLEWFEWRLGPYPWGGEKLGFVETPHLGMEHQTLNGYGNEFKRDPHAFDWLLHHELAHEWFGNLMTHERSNDAWLHEGYGMYMQAAYSLDRYGEAAYLHRLYEAYLGLENCEPVVPDRDVTSEEAFIGDIYGKGAWFLHTLRWLIGEEPFWRATRRLLYDTSEPWDLPYPIEPVYRSTEDLERIVFAETGRDLGWMFDVYLREAELPTLIERRVDGGLQLEWQVPGGRGFAMPVPVRVEGTMHLVEMVEGRGFVPIEGDARVIVDPEMTVLRYLPIIGTCEEIEASPDEVAVGSSQLGSSKVPALMKDMPGTASTTEMIGDPQSGQKFRCTGLPFSPVSSKTLRVPVTVSASFGTPTMIENEVTGLLLTVGAVTDRGEGRLTPVAEYRMLPHRQPLRLALASPALAAWLLFLVITSAADQER